MPRSRTTADRERANQAAGLTATGKPRQRRRAKPGGGRYDNRQKTAKLKEAMMSDEEKLYRVRFLDLVARLRTFRTLMPAQSIQENAAQLTSLLAAAEREPEPAVVASPTQPPASPVLGVTDRMRKRDEERLMGYKDDEEAAGA